MSGPDRDVDEIDALLQELTVAGRPRPHAAPPSGVASAAGWRRLTVLGLAGVGALAIVAALGFSLYRLLTPTSGSDGSATANLPTPSTSPDPSLAPAPGAGVVPTTGTTADPTTVPAATPYTPGQVTDDNPDGATRYVVVQDGRLYLRGYVASRQVADQIVAMSAAFSGPEDVVDEQLIDPSVPLDVPTTVYVRDVVLFDLNSTTLRPEQYPLVDTGLVFLQSNPNLTLTVIGRTDATGSAEVNQRIGLARAQAIVDRLVAQGANPAQLVAQSRGEADATMAPGPVAEDRFAQIIVNGSLG